MSHTSCKGGWKLEHHTDSARTQSGQGPNPERCLRQWAAKNTAEKGEVEHGQSHPPQPKWVVIIFCIQPRHWGFCQLDQEEV